MIIVAVHAPPPLRNVLVVIFVYWRRTPGNTKSASISNESLNNDTHDPLALTMFAAVCLHKAWPFIQAMRRKSPFSYIFPNEKNIAQPKFAPMRRYLGMFYGAIVLSIAWASLMLDVH